MLSLITKYKRLYLETKKAALSGLINQSLLQASDELIQ